MLRAGFELNVAVTPVGKPDTDRVTRFLTGAMMISVVPLVPCTMLSVFGEAVSVRPGVTVSLIAVVCVRLPDVPVIVAVDTPGTAAALTVRVNVLVDVAGFGLNAAVTPLGNPEAARVTSPENPFAGVTVILLVPELT